jgi:hypothetical protein
MNQLYPIIRRKRRPLIQENPEILKAEPFKPVVSESRPTAPKQPKANDAKSIFRDESE